MGASPPRASCRSPPRRRLLCGRVRRAIGRTRRAQERASLPGATAPLHMPHSAYHGSPMPRVRNDARIRLYVPLRAGESVARQRPRTRPFCGGRSCDGSIVEALTAQAGRSLSPDPSGEGCGPGGRPGNAWGRSGPGLLYVLPSSGPFRPSFSFLACGWSACRPAGRPSTLQPAPKRPLLLPPWAFDPWLTRAPWHRMLHPGLSTPA